MSATSFLHSFPFFPPFPAFPGYALGSRLSFLGLGRQRTRRVGRRVLRIDDRARCCEDDDGGSGQQDRGRRRRGREHGLKDERWGLGLCGCCTMRTGDATKKQKEMEGPIEFKEVTSRASSSERSQSRKDDEFGCYE